MFCLHKLEPLENHIFKKNHNGLVPPQSLHTKKKNKKKVAYAILQKEIGKKKHTIQNFNRNVIVPDMYRTLYNSGIL